MEKVFAQGVDIGTTFSPARSFPTFGSLVNVIVRNALVIAGIIAFVLLIVAGFQFIVGAGSGDPKKFEQTRTNILIAVIGLIVIAGAVWIVQIVQKITGPINGLNFVQP